MVGRSIDHHYGLPTEARGIITAAKPFRVCARPKDQRMIRKGDDDLGGGIGAESRMSCSGTCGV